MLYRSVAIAFWNQAMSAVDFTRFVHDLATRSGEAILPFFRTAMTTYNKAGAGQFDPVTEGDRAGEMVMRRMIRDTFPAHGIIGEEFGSQDAGAQYVWVLDPIDGTRAFVSGLPVWGTLIGLMRDGEPAYGMMHQPFTRERFFGDGQSAGYIGPEGERSLRVRNCASLADATLMTTSPRLFAPKDRKRYEAVEKASRLTRFGCDCYAYCMLAAGHVDLVIEAGLQAYDIVALVPIIEGAGGIVTSWDGGSPAQGGRILAAGDRRVHQAALEHLAG
jgi:histidinol phosphatase-like enzyme (inositol monophosphatase family)